MLLFPFMGLGLVKLHTISAAAWAGGRHYRHCRNCIYRDCRRRSNARPCERNSCPGEDNNTDREYQ